MTSNYQFTRGEQSAPLTEQQLLALALRYVGDDGMTVDGTAECMAYMDQVRKLEVGNSIPLPGTDCEIKRIKS